METQVFSDPAIIGPGIWFDIHVTAINATTNKLKEAFVIYINNLCENFRCKKCQPHFREFIDNNPLANYWGIYSPTDRKDIGFFKWSWLLHNEVNARLRKYQPTFEEAYRFFANSDMGACFNCPEPEKIPEEPIIIPPILNDYIKYKHIIPRPFVGSGRTISL